MHHTSWRNWHIMTAQTHCSPSTTQQKPSSSSLYESLFYSSFTKTAKNHPGIRVSLEQPYHAS
ncbi:uncharacterized protein LACBIDRAFT_305636 [Laccaria bicolor S238N-H82]|uniref:Predicted protein n=1 Tax=Laccaria bicolor (strain S238N-H82 / ATCC MYA-4686) TaxID=486041 RepID=B0CUP7_LACBS|nr:uncharacterized protein LACBIDRAFT_305636 [Laccaria bicolor S238N-H82]EDR14129.1 predicted protein [Laccaria bicolor S238N-H82]|eukprot:XP_001874688.1 predicted protein [Laccaria bicolor S238N-H82]